MVLNQHSFPKGGKKQFETGLFLAVKKKEPFKNLINVTKQHLHQSRVYTRPKL